jgi:hypothetical protein
MSHVEILVLDQDHLTDFLKKEIRGRPFPYRVRVIDGRDRSAEQNALMWQWAREVSSVTGYTPEEVQARWKGQFGIPILCEDSDRHRELYGRIPWKEGDRESIFLMLEFLPVTSEMTVMQMSNFLDKVYAYYTKLGHYLTDPNDEDFFRANSPS